VQVHAQLAGLQTSPEPHIGHAQPVLDELMLLVAVATSTVDVATLEPRAPPCPDVLLAIPPVPVLPLSSHGLPGAHFVVVETQAWFWHV